MADAVGFEPTLPFDKTAFKAVGLQPLTHASIKDIPNRLRVLPYPFKSHRCFLLKYVCHHSNSSLGSYIATECFSLGNQVSWLSFLAFGLSKLFNQKNKCGVCCSRSPLTSISARVRRTF